MRNTISGKAALAILTVCFTRNAFADDTGSYSGYEFAKEAKISMEQASWWVLNAYPRAVITDRALERDGDSGQLRYVFELKSQAQPFEVSFDAATGYNLEAHFVPNNGTTATGTED
jgi:uncharacterized membrane protein YkoI